jgi:hypothetical protein
VVAVGEPGDVADLDQEPGGTGGAAADAASIGEQPTDWPDDTLCITQGETIWVRKLSPDRDIAVRPFISAGSFEPRDGFDEVRARCERHGSACLDADRATGPALANRLFLALQGVLVQHLPEVVNRRRRTNRVDLGLLLDADQLNCFHWTDVRRLVRIEWLRVRVGEIAL